MPSPSFSLSHIPPSVWRKQPQRSGSFPCKCHIMGCNELWLFFNNLLCRGWNVNRAGAGKVPAQGHGCAATRRKPGMASVPRCPHGRSAGAAGLSLQSLMTACPGLVPDPSSCWHPHLFLWGFAPIPWDTRSWLHRGAFFGVVQGGMGLAPGTLLTDLGEPLWVSPHVPQLCHAVGVPPPKRPGLGAP